MMNNDKIITKLLTFCFFFSGFTAVWRHNLCVSLLIGWRSRTDTRCLRVYLMLGWKKEWVWFEDNTTTATTAQFRFPNPSPVLIENTNTWNNVLFVRLKSLESCVGKGGSRVCSVCTRHERCLYYTVGWLPFILFIYVVLCRVVLFCLSHLRKGPCDGFVTTELVSLISRRMNRRGHWVCWMSTGRENGFMWRTPTQVTQVKGTILLSWMVTMVG